MPGQPLNSKVGQRTSSVTFVGLIFLVTWQKHRRERENKFLQAAQAELDKQVGVLFLK